MADIMVRRPEETARALNPFLNLRNLLRWDPFSEMAPLAGNMENELTFTPAFDVKETGTNYEFRADLPGIKERDIDVTISGNRLAITGSREQEKEEKGDLFYACERSYGSFTRTFTLPETADTEHVHCEMKDGVLSIMIAKQATEQPRKIPILQPKGQV
jgi:HSP20 family protein